MFVHNPQQQVQYPRKPVRPESLESPVIHWWASILYRISCPSLEEIAPNYIDLLGIESLVIYGYTQSKYVCVLRLDLMFLAGAPCLVKLKLMFLTGPSVSVGCRIRLFLTEFVSSCLFTAGFSVCNIVFQCRRLDPHGGHTGGNNVVRLLWKTLLPAPQEFLSVPFTAASSDRSSVLASFWF